MIPKIGINQRLYMLNVINKLSDFLKWTQYIKSLGASNILNINDMYNFLNAISVCF